MEVWREQREERPQVLSARSLLTAFALHLFAFLGLYLYAQFHLRLKEVIIPIDLSVVVVENLDGNEHEPPPLEKIQPEPPKPSPPKKIKEENKPKEEKKPLEQMEIKKPEPKKVEKKPEPKKPEPKKPELKKETQEERMKRMRDSAKLVKTPPKKQPNGRTDKKTRSDEELRKLLNQGYKPGRTTQLATSEEQLAISLIKQAFDAKWSKPAWTSQLKPMVIRVWFGAGGAVKSYKLEESSGDRQADATIVEAAKRVGFVRGLPAAFIEKYGSSGVAIRFTVTAQ